MKILFSAMTRGTRLSLFTHSDGLGPATIIRIFGVIKEGHDNLEEKNRDRIEANKWLQIRTQEEEAESRWLYSFKNQNIRDTRV